MEIESKTLLNNKIDQFILRIDLTPDAMVDFKQLAEKLTSDYGDARTELHVNYNIDMQKVEVKKEEFLKYIMGKAPQITLTLDSFERSIVLESNHYDNNSVYKQRLSKIIALIKEMQPESSALRIGMRYINKFPCLKSSEISKYFNSNRHPLYGKVLMDQCISNKLTYSHLRICGNKFSYSSINAFRPCILHYEGY